MPQLLPREGWVREGKETREREKVEGKMNKRNRRKT